MAFNQLKTVFFLTILTVIALGIGYFIGGTSGLTIAFVIALLLNFGIYWFSDKIVLRIYKAQPVTEREQPELYKIVRDVANRAGIPMPKVYIIPTEHSNAFATGRSPSHASIAFTQGIIRLLSTEELRGVVAHEISHVKNRDILISTIAATIAGVISYVAAMARFGAIFGGLGGNNDRQGNNLIELLVLAIVAPIIAMIIQLAISRSREYQADESAARTLHTGLPLASALQKLDSDIKNKPLRAFGATESTAHLFIANPFTAKGVASMFSTHPSIDARVARLKNMHF
ncbi:MAG: zinc metalloprotease HtpX [Candidatus Woesearchaeota archaeon]